MVSGDTLAKIGGGLLGVGGGIVSLVPVAFAVELAIIGGAPATLGFVFGPVMIFCGAVAVFKPEYAVGAGFVGDSSQSCRGSGRSVASWSDSCWGFSVARWRRTAVVAGGPIRGPRVSPRRIDSGVSSRNHHRPRATTPVR